MEKTCSPLAAGRSVINTAAVDRVGKAHGRSERNAPAAEIAIVGKHRRKRNVLLNFRHRPLATLKAVEAINRITDYRRSVLPQHNRYCSLKRVGFKNRM